MLTRAFTGLDASMLRPSIEAAGLDPGQARRTGQRGAREAAIWRHSGKPQERPKRWADIWSAGHSVSGVRDVVDTSVLVARLAKDATIGSPHGNLKGVVPPGAIAIPSPECRLQRRGPNRQDPFVGRRMPLSRRLEPAARREGGVSSVCSMPPSASSPSVASRARPSAMSARRPATAAGSPLITTKPRAVCSRQDGGDPSEVQASSAGCRPARSRTPRLLATVDVYLAVKDVSSARTLALIQKEALTQQSEYRGILRKFNRQSVDGIVAQIQAGIEKGEIRRDGTRSPKRR